VRSVPESHATSAIRQSARGRKGSWPDILADLDSLTETRVEQDNKCFLLRSPPRPAASLALAATGVALPVTQTDSRSFRGTIAGLGFAYCDFIKESPRLQPTPRRQKPADAATALHGPCGRRLSQARRSRDAPPRDKSGSRRIRGTDCVAGVIGLELRNPLGSKSARVAAGSSGDVAETPQQRLFAFELPGGGYAAATGISAGVAGTEGRTA
jgi:hypothetical protein